MNVLKDINVLAPVVLSYIGYNKNVHEKVKVCIFVCYLYVQC